MSLALSIGNMRCGGEFRHNGVRNDLWIGTGSGRVALDPTVVCSSSRRREDEVADVVVIPDWSFLLATTVREARPRGEDHTTVV
jgi:hypothetical protein